MKQAMISTISTSKQRCAWHLSISFDLMNLREIHSASFSYDDMLYSTEIILSLSLFSHRKLILSNTKSRSSLQSHWSHLSVLSPHFIIFILASLATHHTPSFPTSSIRSIGNTSSPKSKNYSFELASRQLDSQVISYAKKS